MSSRFIVLIRSALFLCAFCIATIVALSLYFEISPNVTTKQLVRIAGTQAASVIHSDELDQARDIEQSYMLGGSFDFPLTPEKSWAKVSKKAPFLSFGLYSGAVYSKIDVPFIYADYLSPHLQRLSENYGLKEKVSGYGSEYEAMLAVAAWVGTRWDHGTDNPNGGAQNFKAIDAIEQGASGKRFWCEVAARTMSQVASSLAWPSRVISLSRNGYDWEHAVVELWSNQYEKWFVVDTDFNVVYEDNGKPLSVYELVHEGEYLKNSGRLLIKNFAPLKPFFLKRGGETREMNDLGLLRYYAYAHVDMRNDWPTRTLSKGSPAGGDRATYYTSNSSIPSPLNAMRKASSKSEFNWPVNFVEVYLDDIKMAVDGAEIAIVLKAYAPYVANIQARIDSKPWAQADSGLNYFDVASGKHTLDVRLKLINGYGPITKVSFEVGGQEKKY